jgi:hypothetical protein
MNINTHESNVQKTCPCSKLTKQHSMKVYGGSGDIGLPFLISTLEEGEWPASLSGRFIPRTQWIGCWVGHVVGLDLWSKEKSLALSRNRTPAVQRVAIPTELARISIKDRSSKQQPSLSTEKYACLPSSLLILRCCF